MTLEDKVYTKEEIMNWMIEAQDQRLETTQNDRMYMCWNFANYYIARQANISHKEVDEYRNRFKDQLELDFTKKY